jgi:hypothetical protein
MLCRLPSHAELVRKTQQLQLFQPYPDSTGNSQRPILLNNVETPLRPAFATPSFPAQRYARSLQAGVSFISSSATLLTGANCCKSKLLLTTTFCSLELFFFLSCFFLSISACSWWLSALLVTPHIPTYSPNHLLLYSRGSDPSKSR